MQTHASQYQSYLTSLAKDTVVALYNLQTDSRGEYISSWETEKKVTILLDRDQFTCLEPGVAMSWPTHGQSAYGCRRHRGRRSVAILARPRLSYEQDR